jgi:hypothetical protein
MMGRCCDSRFRITPFLNNIFLIKHGKKMFLTSISQLAGIRLTKGIGKEDAPL